MHKARSHSYNSVNRVGTYNFIDAKIDNPHRPTRELPAIVREVREIRFRPRGKRMESHSVR